MNKSRLLKMSQLPEENGRYSNKYAIFCGSTNIAFTVLACYNLLMMRHVFIKNIELHGSSVFPSSFMIMIFVIGIIILMLIGLFLIIRFKNKKTILTKIILVITASFFILYSMTAWKLYILWHQFF